MFSLATGAMACSRPPMPVADSSDALSIMVGDSAEVSYDSAVTRAVDVVCVHCSPNATFTRLAPNAMRVFANHVADDKLDRAVCFTVRQPDGKESSSCVPLAIAPAPLAAYSVPTAIREAEAVSLHAMPVETYDHTGQSAHPDFLRIHVPWSAQTCWLAFTPYADENIEHENPSLASSMDCEHWTPARGVKAPLVDKPANGYNSDPDLMYDAARGCLGVMFRQVTTVNSILLTQSCDGTTWSAPRALFSVPNHGAISPTVTVGADGRNRVWYVAAGAQGCGAHENVVMMRAGSAAATTPLDRVEFGEEVPTNLAQPDWVIWHIKVRYIAEKREYWAMYAAFPRGDNGGCLNNDLFVATSADGLHWQTYPVPMMDHLDNRFHFRSLYRASFVYEAPTDQLRTILSAKDSIWGQFGVVHNYAALRHALDTSLVLPKGASAASARLIHTIAPARRRMILNARP